MPFRWPLVSREAYDERGTLIAEMRARIAHSDALVESLTQTAWPLVSREAYDERGTLIAEMRARIAHSDALVESLTQTALSMKQQGYTVSPPIPQREEVEPSPVDEAIAAKAGRNPALRRHLTMWAAAERTKDGMSDEAVADAIWHWSASEVDD